MSISSDKLKTGVKMGWERRKRYRRWMEMVENRVCERAVCDNVVCERVVCDRLSVKEVCVKESCAKELL